MNDDKDWLAQSFWNYATDGMIDEVRIFTDELMQPLVAEFSIPKEAVGEVQLALELGARSYRMETERAKADNEAHRENLDALQKAANQLKSVIADMPTEIWQLLHHSGVGRTLGGVPFPRTIAVGDGANMELQFQRPGSADVVRIELETFSLALDAISECSANGKRAAGEGKRGRPPNEGLFDLMLQAYQVWVRLLGREFRLDWTDDKSPITPGALFTFAVAHAVDPSLAPKKIITASVKARAFGKETIHLEKMPEIVQFFSKRFE